MKLPLALLAGLLLAMSAAFCPAQDTGAQFIREMLVNAAVQERFYAVHPDLADEREVVAEALRQLVPQEIARMSVDEAAEALAGRARTVLSLRTPAEWQRKAVSLYPELGVAGSEFNRRFLERYRELERTSPQFRQEPSWPVLLAKRCADELRAPAEAKGKPGTDAGTPAALETASASPAARVTTPAGRLLAVLSVVVLAGILSLPAVWLWRVSRPWRNEAAALWQRALRPTAWVYLVVVLFALFRTFAANAGETAGNRFFITLYVSLLAGFVVLGPAFLAAWGIGWWWQRLGPAAADAPAGWRRWIAPARRFAARLARAKARN